MGNRCCASKKERRGGLNDGFHEAMNEPKEQAQEQVQPITHRFTINEEESFVKALHDQTTILTIVGRLVMQYAALRPGETPDSQVFIAQLQMYTNTFVNVSPLPFDCGVQLLAKPEPFRVLTTESIGVVITNQPRLHFTINKIGSFISKTGLTHTFRSHIGNNTTTDEFKKEEGFYRVESPIGHQSTRYVHLPNSVQKRLNLPSLEGLEGRAIFDFESLVVQITDTFAFFYNAYDTFIWAAPWRSLNVVKTDGTTNNETTIKGFQVIVEREGNEQTWIPKVPLFEIQSGRFVQIVQSSSAIDVYEYRFDQYRFDDHTNRSNYLLQRTLKPPSDNIHLAMQWKMSPIQRGDKVIFITSSSINVMFFAADSWSFRSYRRSNLPHNLPHTNQSFNNQSQLGSEGNWEYICGDWLVLVYKWPDGNVSVSRVSLDTRFLTPV